MQNRKGLWAVAIALIFWVLFYIGISHHEMWRDELQVWALVKSSTTIPALLHNMRYEGHPALWHILVYIVAQFSDNPFSMALLHITIAAVTVFVVIRYAPFVWWQRLLLVSGYFFAYEYTVISRNYGIEVLLFLAVCALLKHGSKYLLSITILLFFICQCNVFAVIIAICLFAFVIYNSIQPKAVHVKVIIATLLFIIGIAISLWQMIPPADSDFAKDWIVLSFPAGYKAFSTICTSYIPIPILNFYFWDSTIFTNTLLADCISAILLVILIVRYFKKPILLLFFLGSTFGLILFFYSKYSGSVRHHGQVYIVFIICEWLYIQYKDSRAERFDKLFNYLFVLILVLQTATACYANCRDYNDPFSECKYAANYIKINKLDNLEIICYKDYVGASISTLINKPVFNLGRNQYITYTIWDNKRGRMNMNSFIERVKQMANTNHKDYVVVLNTIYEDYLHFDNIEPLAFYGKSIEWTEGYYIYKVHHTTP